MIRSYFKIIKKVCQQKNAIIFGSFLSENYQYKNYQYKNYHYAIIIYKYVISLMNIYFYVLYSMLSVNSSILSRYELL